MGIVDIAVPDENDSFSRVVLDSVQYLIRFTWNDTAGRWTFGLYTMQRECLVSGIKLVSRFPLNLQIVDDRFPAGIFGVYSDFETIERNSFIEGKSAFSYIPASLAVNSS